MTTADGLLTIALVALAYFLGALPFGVWIARKHGVDIQKHGSGNTGATNVARTLGWRVGLMVLALDAAKGALPTALAMMIIDEPAITGLVGYVAVVGHCLSPFLGGKGGKGVATALGVFLIVDLHACVFALLAFLLVWRVTRVPALGSLAGVAAIFVVEAMGDVPEYSVLAAGVFVFLVWTHRTNLAKLATRFR